MTAPTTLTATRPASPLGHRILRINAIFSGLSGLALILASGPIAQLIGVSPAWILILVGIGVVGWEILLWRLSARPVSRTELIAIAVADLVWVAASALLLFSGWVPFTTAGQWIVGIIAEIVFWFAVVEFYAAYKLKRN